MSSLYLPKEKKRKKKKQFQALTLGLLTVKTSQNVSFNIPVLLHHQKIGSKSI